MHGFGVCRAGLDRRIGHSHVHVQACAFETFLMQGTLGIFWETTLSGSRGRR